MLTTERLRELIHYDRTTGVFSWRVRRIGNGGRINLDGKECGGLRGGYRRIRVDGRKYTASHLAWLYVTGEWPPTELDHKNLNRGDDSFDNLRLATHSQNCGNTPKRLKNKTGFKGCYPTESGKFTAQVAAIHLGTFDTPEEAHAAYCRAAAVRFGEFARPA